jgi:hypothetical protein
MKKGLYILLITIISIPAWAQNPASLMAWYPCTGNFNDQSGNARHGTVTGAVLSPDKHGNATGAYTFDGVDDYVTLPILGPYTAFTLMTRVKFTSTELMNIFSGYEAGWYPSVFAGKVRWYDGTAWRVTSSAINNNQWHDIAYIFDNGTYSLYVDGVIEYTGVGAASITTGRVSILGKVATVSMRFFQGSMDDLRVYNVALTAGEINAIMSGYAVSWTEIVNLTLNSDNSLVKSTGSNGWANAGAAISVNQLQPNQNGWMQFTTNSSLVTGQTMLGLSNFRTEITYATINYALYFNNGNVTIYENGNLISSHGTYTTGETFRISREGALIKYYRGGTVIRSLTVSADLVLNADVSVNTVGGYVPPVTVSFDRQLMVTPVVTTLSNVIAEDGGIALTVSGGDAPYTYAWSSGETTSSIANKPVGSYQVTITDAASRTLTRKYLIGVDVTWTDLLNAIENADKSLTRTAAGQSWSNSSGVTRNVLPAGQDGAFELIIPAASSSTYMISLSKLNNLAEYWNSDYSFNVSGSNLYIYEGPANRGLVGTVTVGDRLRISRVSNSIIYEKNNTVLRTVTLANNNDNLRIDANLFYGSIPSVVATFSPTLSIKPSITYPTALTKGSISVSTESNYNPVSYSWSTGETTSFLTNMDMGSYTLIVNDALGRSVTKTYELGYAMAWTNLVNVSVSANNSLVKTDADGWTSGASSLNVLAPNTDGWIEFVVYEPASEYSIGMSRMDKGPSYAGIGYSWLVSGKGNYNIYESNVAQLNIGSFMKGDVLRIARVGSAIKYYINGEEKRSVATTAAWPLMIDVSFNTKGETPVVTASFDRLIRIQPTIKPSVIPNAGSIELNVQGVYDPAVITWSSGETSATISNKTKGIYTVSVSDAAGRSVSRSFRLGYPVEWTDLKNVLVDVNNVVYKSSGSTTASDAAAVSASALPSSADGWMEFSLPALNSKMMMGLARPNSVAEFGSIDYAYYFWNDDVYIWESGMDRGKVAVQNAADIYTIAREGSNIKYYINGVVVRTVSTNATYQLIADLSIMKGTASLVTTSFGKNPQAFYSIASGNWNSGTNWSFSEGGVPANVFPSAADAANIIGHTILINSNFIVGSVNITAIDSNTCLKIDGASGSLTVKGGKVIVKGENNTTTARALIVQNGGKIIVEDQ